MNVNLSHPAECNLYRPVQRDREDGHVVFPRIFLECDRPRGWSLLGQAVRHVAGEFYGAGFLGVRLPYYPGYEWRRMGGDIVLIAIGTGVVYEVLEGMLY